MQTKKRVAMRWMRAAGLTMALCVASAHAWAADGESSTPLVDGVIVDLSVPSVYAMASADSANGEAISRMQTPGDDFLIAFDPRTGKMLWKSKAASKPLLVVGNALVVAGAHGSERGIAVLDKRNGKAKAVCATDESSAAPLPLYDRLGARYGIHAVLHEGTPVVIATTSTYYAGGAAPDPETLRASQSHTTHAYAVDLSTGCSRHVETPEAEPVLYAKAGGAIDAFSAGELEVSVEAVRGHDSYGLVLHRKRGEKKLPDIDLATATAGNLQAAASLDRRHIATYRQRRDEHGRFSYDVTIVELATGARTEAKATPFNLASFVVIGDVVVFGRGAAYGGRITKDGEWKQLWVHAVPSTQYTGPYPP